MVFNILNIKFFIKGDVNRLIFKTNLIEILNILISMTCNYVKW